MTCSIKLTNGMITYVDDVWIERLRTLTWTCLYNGGTNLPYAFNEYNRMFLHQFVCYNHRIVDHINKDTLDNREVNLRPSTFSMNALNQKPRKPERRISKGKTVYVAQLGLHGKQHYFGTFATEDVAIRITEFNRRRAIAGLPLVFLNRSNSN